MSINQPPVEPVSVDRRAETVTTQEPGYVASERVVTDVAAERRLGAFQITRILYTLLGILEILLMLRFVLKLLAANAESGFSVFIYGVTAMFVAPFDALLGTPTYAGAVFETNTLIAMAVYALLFWIIARIIQIAVDRPTARSVSRTTHEETRRP